MSKDTDASAAQTGLSSATPIEPVPVSPVPASIPSAVARQALNSTEMARTGVTKPANGSGPYSWVVFHGERVPFYDREFTTQQDRDAGTAQAAAYATKINDALFELATRAAALAVARCLDVVRETREGFLSPQYATGQPFSSIQERFACTQCAGAIEAASAIEAREGQDGEAGLIADESAMATPDAK